MAKNKLQKHPGGRPTKYNPDVFRKIKEYLSMCGREQTGLPSLEGLALHLDVRRETIWEWSKRYPEFSNSLKKIAEKQKQQLMEDGMYGGKEVNAAMAIFLLKAVHRMKDGSSVAVQVNVKPILGGDTLVDVQTDDSNQKAVKAKKEN